MSARKKVSLETMDDHEQHDPANTPRSLEACYREGIDPTELLYRPPEDFLEKGLSPRIQELNYNVYESKRKDSLALARKTRRKIIEGLERSVQKSYSESKLSSTANFQTQIERLKEKKVRAIKEMVNLESQTTETLLAKDERERKRRQDEEMRKRESLKLGKEKIDQKVISIQRIEDEKAYRESQRKDKSARKRAAKELRKKTKAEEARREREATEAKNRADQIQQSDEKFRQKLQYAEEIFLKDKLTLEQRLAQEQMMDIERRKAIKKQRQELKAKLKLRSREIEQKRLRAIANFEQELEEVMRSVETQRIQRAQIARGAEIRPEKERKSAKIMLTTAQIEEEKRKKVMKRMEMIEKNVKRQREVMTQHLEFRKHINMLKQLKKEWNIRRKQRKDEYMKAVSEEKLKLEDEKVKEFLRERRDMVRSLTEMNRAADLQHHQLKEAVHTMAITKKWSPHTIEKLAGGSVDLTCSTRNTARVSARPFTAGI